MTDSTHVVSALVPKALVTGGARRIGAAITRALHQEGYKVFIHCNRSTKEAHELADELNRLRIDSAEVVQADLNSLKQIDELSSRVLRDTGGLDVLINNASSFYPTPLGSVEEHHWNDLINSNLKAPFFLSQQLHGALAERRGVIINLTDIFAERPMPGHSVYCIAKAGNVMLTKSLALELAPKVRVNGIAPGAILWPEDSQGEQKVNIGKLASIPLSRLGGTEAITTAIRYLIRDADYVTGQIISIDGGRSLLQ